MLSTTTQPTTHTYLQAYFEVREGDEFYSRVDIKKSRTTLGRRSYNDIELLHATVSGEHAVIHVQRGEIIVHDLNSRNGTLVNGQSVMQHALTHGDEIEVGVYRLRLFVQQRGNGSFEQTPALMSASLFPMADENNAESSTNITSLDPIDLKRPITSIGKQGQFVAVVARRRNTFFVTHLEGVNFPTVNGESIGLRSFPLDHNDLLNIGGQNYRLQVSASS